MAEPFPDSVVEKAWERSGGRCECTRKSHPIHSKYNRCTVYVIKSSRGNRNSKYGWETHHINSNGESILSNCEILCSECHKLTF